MAQDEAIAQFNILLTEKIKDHEVCFRKILCNIAERRATGFNLESYQLFNLIRQAGEQAKKYWRQTGAIPLFILPRWIKKNCSEGTPRSCSRQFYLTLPYTIISLYLTLKNTGAPCGLQGTAERNRKGQYDVHLGRGARTN